MSGRMEHTHLREGEPLEQEQELEREGEPWEVHHNPDVDDLLLCRSTYHTGRDKGI